MFDLISITIGAAGGAVGGALIMATFAGAKVKAMRDQCEADIADRAALEGWSATENEADALREEVAGLLSRILELRQCNDKQHASLTHWIAENDRRAAAIAVLQKRRDDALACVTDKANGTTLRMARILRGEA